VNYTCQTCHCVHVDCQKVGRKVYCPYCLADLVRELKKELRKLKGVKP